MRSFPTHARRGQRALGRVMGTMLGRQAILYNHGAAFRTPHTRNVCKSGRRRERGGWVMDGGADRRDTIDTSSRPMGECVELADRFAMARAFAPLMFQTRLCVMTCPSVGGHHGGWRLVNGDGRSAQCIAVLDGIVRVHGDVGYTDHLAARHGSESGLQSGVVAYSAHAPPAQVARGIAFVFFAQGRY